MLSDERIALPVAGRSSDKYVFSEEIIGNHNNFISVMRDLTFQHVEAVQLSRLQWSENVLQTNFSK